MHSENCLPVDEKQLLAWGETIINSDATLVDRAHALWGLRHARENLATQLLCKFIVDIVPPSPSANALLQHEAAYCLGQKGDPTAVDALEQVIRNTDHETIVRHEAGEALAALAKNPEVDINRIRSILSEFVSCPIIELSETCEIGLGRLDWVSSSSEHPEDPAVLLAEQRFPNTVDPTPAFPHPSTKSISFKDLKMVLLSPEESLYSRYQALFSLRNAAVNFESDETAMCEIIDTLSASLAAPGSALLRHEAAFVLGQLSISRTGPALLYCLQDLGEHPMVRHEAAMALGEVFGVAEVEASRKSDLSNLSKDFVNSARSALFAGLNDSHPVVRDSCALALDIADYVASADRFQYAAVPSPVS